MPPCALPSCLLVALACLAGLTACGSGGIESASHSRSRSTAAATGLDSQRITLRAAAGAWQAVRLVIDESFWSGTDEVRFGLGIEATGAATPYLALGTYASTPGIQGVPVVVFTGFPEGQSDGFVLRMRRSEDAQSPQNLRVEMVFAFGSNQDSAILHLGKLQTADPGSGLGLVQLLAARPEISHQKADGRGGFTGSYARFVDDSGELREIRSGNLQVTTSGPVPTTEGFSLAQTTHLQGTGTFSTGGWYSLAFFSQPETGLQHWSMDARLPPETISESGLWANAGLLQSPVEVQLLGLRPAGYFAQGRSAAGSAELMIERTLTGRDGTASGLVAAGLFASWGWISADFERLYGWPMPAVMAEPDE